MKKQGYKTYQRVNVQTADPTRLVVLLYEGTIRNLNQATDHFAAGRNVEASERIKKTLDIINYLHSVLDFDNGGEVAANLARLYDYVRDALAEANIHKDLNGIENAIRVLRPLLEGWQGITRNDDDDAPDAPPDPAEHVQLRMVG